MKELYGAPTLIAYGAVEDLTALSNDSDRVDRLYDGEQTIGESHGSRDGCLEPNPGTGTCDIP